MWEGDAIDLSEDRLAELEGLQLLIQVWQVRDVRFRLFDRSIDDARKALTARRRADRARAVSEFAAALTLSPYGDDGDDERGKIAGQPMLWLPDSERERALHFVPDGADRDLVRLALDARAHVFLTCDKGVLRSGGHLRVHGLFVASPLELVEELTACGALLCVLRRETTTWPVPDLQRMSHLIQALG